MIRATVVLLSCFTILTGIIYPLVVNIVGQYCFPKQANGSLITDSEGQIIGSSLIGQNFTAAKYLWSRPSATSDYPYNPLASGGSNLAPTNDDLHKIVLERMTVLKRYKSQSVIPIDLVTASASGLDPEISLAAAYFQVPRIAYVRNISELAVRQLIDQCTSSDINHFFAPVVNVLAVNLALDRQQNFIANRN